MCADLLVILTQPTLSLREGTGTLSVDALLRKLAAALPKSHRFIIHHLSTPPTSCPAIYSAPPGQRPERTTCESHFLSVSINHNDRQIQVFALEVLVYATQYLTTLFVSKADSTGYIHLLNLPKGTPSPLKTISSTFITHLVEARRRKDRQLVVSLFARSQDQYLFPGSIENPTKHVLDDRGLIKWWCRVLEPVLHPNDFPDPQNPTPRPKKPTASAYLRVPSCDIHETRSFFPPHVRRTPSLLANWHPNRDPLRSLSGRSPTSPERCLIPRFPDDPKSRFVDELDDELTEPPSASQTKESPSKGKRPGRWRSVRSLEQFWELMAFRQECSSGRLVGFLWAVFTPAGFSAEDRKGTSSPTQDHAKHNGDFGPVGGPPEIPSALQPLDADTLHPEARASSPKTNAKITEPPTSPAQKKSSALMLPAKHYARINRLLLHLDYADLDIAAESSKRWIEDVAVCAGKESWGFEVVGEREMVGGGGGGGGGGDVVEGANVLGGGLVRKKRRDGEGEGVEVGKEGEGAVNVLAMGLVRKKPKVR
ncbi:MAG: hypothetical protein L6R40_004603 [Gallowayella cf. fulva]|nr:MAG: hypothetical protein L6R40_004603 [Xanthomendoza cf. fulva]